jgi:hypothetical protein
MSLDIAILGADGTPKKQVSIGVDDHYELMKLVGNGDDRLLSRLSNYYADAEFNIEELGNLHDEVQLLLERSRQNIRMSSFLTVFMDLINQAKSEQKPLLAISD